MKGLDVPIARFCECSGLEWSGRQQSSARSHFNLVYHDALTVVARADVMMNRNVVSLTWKRPTITLGGKSSCGNRGFERYSATDMPGSSNRSRSTRGRFWLTSRGQRSLVRLDSLTRTVIGNGCVCPDSRLETRAVTVSDKTGLCRTYEGKVWMAFDVEFMCVNNVSYDVKGEESGVYTLFLCGMLVLLSLFSYSILDKNQYQGPDDFFHGLFW